MRANVGIEDTPSSPKEKKGIDKRKLKKSESSEKRRLKTRKSSKNKDKEGSATASTMVTTHVRSESAPIVPSVGATFPSSTVGSFIPESESSIAFDSSDEVAPLAETQLDSEDNSLATSTTNLRGQLGQTDYHSSRSRRASYHSHRDSMLGEGSHTSGGRSSWKVDHMAGEKERQEDMETLRQLQSRSVEARRGDQPFLLHRLSNGSDESDDGEETWKRSETLSQTQKRNSGFYDGLSSAHSSDSEGAKRRSAALKPRPLTERRPLSERLFDPQFSSATVSSGSAFRAASSDDRIKINVGGRLFETYVSTLRKYPHTLLGTMLHPRNAHLLGSSKTGPDGKPSADTELFFDRNPRMFEVILDFYRTSQIHRPPDVSWEMLQEELSFFQIDLPEYTNLSKRVSVELRKLEYKDLILPASEYRKMTRVKLLKEHHSSITRILDFIQQKIQRKADAGHNTSTITFYSPLHYTNSTPREIFKVISTNEIRELLVEHLRSKEFNVRETSEYSKTKTTSIIGLHDQIINYNDPQYFSFHIKW